MLIVVSVAAAADDAIAAAIAHSNPNVHRLFFSSRDERAIGNIIVHTNK